MLNGDVLIREMHSAPEERLHGWEEKLIEWCFKYPENNICNVYFNALMKKDFRYNIHGGAAYA